MRQIDSSVISGEGKLVLLTSRDLTGESRLMAADFRDMQALIYTPTGNWIGVNVNGVRLGKSSLEMIDGIWYMDEEVNNEHQSVRLSPELLSFEVIK
jgi:hypothetical protein